MTAPYSPEETTPDRPSGIQQVIYRGYAIIHNDVAADIWYGSTWITSEPTLDKAKKTIDSYHEGT